MSKTRRLLEHPLYPGLLWALYLGLVGVFVHVIDHQPPHEITGFLQKALPWILRGNLALLALCLLACRRDIRRALTLPHSHRATLAALLLLGLVLVTLVAPRTHRIFFDEDIYGNVAQTMARADRAAMCNYGTFEYGEYKAHWLSYNKQPAGWPFLVSIAFQLLGTNELYAFALNNALFLGSIALAFFLARTLFRSSFAAAMAALAYTLIPQNLHWFNTASAEPSAACLTAALILSVITWLRTRKKRHLLLSAALLPLACQMRPESVLLIPWTAAAILILSPRTTLDRTVWTTALLAALLLLPHGLHLFATSGHSWGSDGTKFSLEFFGDNLSTNGLFYLNNKLFPALLTALAALGLAFAPGLPKRRLLLLAWLLPFWGIFLFFYAGSYRYGADIRFALVSFMPLALLAGGGAQALRRALQRLPLTPHGPALGIAVLIALAALPFLPHVRTVGQEAWSSRTSHALARQWKDLLPSRSIVLSQVPSMWLLWGQGAIQTYAGENDPGLIETLLRRYNGHVYFFHGYWCNTRNERNRRLCQTMQDRYRLEPIATDHEQDATYTLYRLKTGPQGPVP